MKFDKFTNVADFAKNTFKRSGFIVKSKSPEILAVVGIAGIITSAVMACIASTKVKDTVEEAKNIIEDTHNEIEENDFDEKQTRKEITFAYTRAGWKIAKPYVAPVVLGIASIGSLIGSTAIYRKRNAALAVTCTMLDKSFKDYRARIVEKFGEEADNDARLGLFARKFDKTITDLETGKEKKAKETVKVCEHDIPNNAWDRFFDETNLHFRKNAEYNQLFIEQQQAFANKLLRRDGYIMLNDVYDLLGLDRSKDGFQVGWIFDPDHPDKIDFGLTTVNRMRSQDFLDGYERSVILSFNVDGYIMDKIPIRTR